jgi:hypothetical protein
MALRALGQKSAQVLQGFKEVWGEVPEVTTSLDVVITCTCY